MKPASTTYLFLLTVSVSYGLCAPTARAQTGSCCLSQVGQIDCIEMSAADCALASGTYGGDGSLCPSEIVAPYHLAGPATDIYLRPVVGCLDVGTAGESCVSGPGPLVDAWVTAPPGFGEDSCHTFGAVPESPPIPANFFGPGSDPFFGTVCFFGDPVGPTPFGDFGLADTLVLRSDDPFDRCDIPSPTERTVDIQIVALSLQSTQPIVVTFNGGQNPTPWDVSVDLSSNGPIPGGMSATKIHCNGGTYNSVVPILPRFTFVDPGSPSNIRIYDTGVETVPPVDLNALGTPWVQQLDIGVSNENPQCSNFHPGIDDLDPPVDCPTPAQERVKLKLVSPATELTFEAGVHCSDSTTSGLSCVAGPPIDPWRVATPGPGNETCHQFGTGPESPPIPAGFFGPGSDPFVGQVCFVGEPLGPTPFGSFGEADTLILRSSDPFDRCDIPSPADQVVDIEIVALSLRSIRPITVVTGGGPTQWDVFVDLSSNAVAPGTLTTTKTHCNGGTYNSFLGVQPRFTFVRVSDPLDIHILDTGDAGIPPIQFFNSNEPWVSDLDPIFIPESPNCTDFQPGLGELAPQGACDCQSNGVRDTCDLESATSFDCNLNQSPDECDGDLPGDYDASGVVDLGDYASFHSCLGGPNAPPSGLPECNELCRSVFDIDADLDIDLRDFKGFVEAFDQP